MNPDPTPPDPAPQFRRPTRRPEDPLPPPPPRPYPGPRAGGWRDGRPTWDRGNYRRPYPYPRRDYGPRPYENRPRPFRPDRPAPLTATSPGAPGATTAMSGPARAAADPQLQQRLQRVKLFLCDVDGILTDAGVYMGNGEETKRFNIRDGFGLRLLQSQGVKVGWVSHRASVATTKRAEDLQIDFLHQAPGSKVEAIEGYLAQTQLTWDDVCFMGDDLVDLGALKRAGLAVTVHQAIPEAKALAHYVTRASGGHGAVREVAEMILKAQNKWASLVAEYSA